MEYIRAYYIRARGIKFARDILVIKVEGAAWDVEESGRVKKRKTALRERRSLVVDEEARRVGGGPDGERWRKMEREIEEFLCFSTKRAFHRDKSIRLRTKRDAAHKVLRHQAASCRVSLVRVARTDRPEMRKDLPRVIFHF